MPFLSTYTSEGCFLRNHNIGFIPSYQSFISFLLSIALSYIQDFLISRCKQSCMLTGTSKKQGWEKKKKKKKYSWKAREARWTPVYLRGLKVNCGWTQIFDFSRNSEVYERLLLKATFIQHMNPFLWQQLTRKGPPLNSSRKPPIWTQTRPGRCF